MKPNKDYVKAVIINEGVMYAVTSYFSYKDINEKEVTLRELWRRANQSIQDFQHKMEKLGYEPGYLVHNASGYEVIINEKGEQKSVSELSENLQKDVLKIDVLLKKIVSFVGLKESDFDEHKLSKGGNAHGDSKISRVMHEFKEGKLKTPNGEVVKKRSQAIAIAMSEAGLSKKEQGGNLETGGTSDSSSDMNAPTLGGTMTSSLKEGGNIPDNYEGKSEKEIWDMWTPKQRSHYLIDHEAHIRVLARRKKPVQKLEKNITKYVGYKFEDLPAAVSDSTFFHKAAGQYSKGGNANANAALVSKIEKAIKTKKAWALYQKFEDNNQHSENAVLLSYAVGSEEDKKESLHILKAHQKSGGITNELQDERKVIEDKLWPLFAMTHKPNGNSKPTEKTEEKQQSWESSLSSEEKELVDSILVRNKDKELSHLPNSKESMKDFLTKHMDGFSELGQKLAKSILEKIS